MFLSFENFPWNNYLVISYFSLSIFSALLEHPMLNFVDQISAIFPLFTISVFSVPLPGKVLQIYFSTLLLVFFMSTVIFTFSKSSFLFFDIPFYMTSFLLHGCNRSLSLA